VDEMLEFLKTQIGPGHPLYRKKLAGFLVSHHQW